MSDQEKSQKRQWLSKKTTLLLSTAIGFLAFMASFVHLLWEDQESSRWIYVCSFGFYLSWQFWRVLKKGTEASVEVVAMFAILFVGIFFSLYL